MGRVPPSTFPWEKQSRRPSNELDLALDSKLTMCFTSSKAIPPWDHLASSFLGCLDWIRHLLPLADVEGPRHAKTRSARAPGVQGEQGLRGDASLGARSAEALGFFKPSGLKKKAKTPRTQTKTKQNNKKTPLASSHLRPGIKGDELLRLGFCRRRCFT